MQNNLSLGFRWTVESIKCCTII